MHLIWLRTDLRLHDNTALGRRSQRADRRRVPDQPGAMAGP